MFTHCTQWCLRHRWEKMVDDAISLDIRLIIFPPKSPAFLPGFLGMYINCFEPDIETQEQFKQQGYGPCTVLRIPDWASEELPTIMHDFGFDSSSLSFLFLTSPAEKRVIAQARRTKGEDTFIMEIAHGEK